jgi:DinB superfamily
MREQTLELLHQLEQQVEQHLQTAIRVFQNATEHQLLQPSGTGGWSIAQNLWHLNSYGDFYFRHIQSAVGSNENNMVDFKSGWLGAYFVKMMHPQSGKQKFKAFKNHVPPDALDAYLQVATFIHQQELLLGYLKQARFADLNKRLPVSISNLVKLKLGDVFQFIIAHNERHIQQALRNID